MNKTIYSTLFLFALGLMTSCQKETDYLDALNGNDPLIRANQVVTDVMVHDIFSPPVASRVYAYASLAAYEVAALADDEYISLMGQLNEFEKKDFDTSKECLFPLAALAAYYQVAASMIFSDEPMMEQRDRIYRTIKNQGIPSDVFQNSMSLGKEVADHVMA